MAVGSFLFLKEQIKGIIIISPPTTTRSVLNPHPHPAPTPPPVPSPAPFLQLTETVPEPVILGYDPSPM
jgi:hypothetical protein